MRPDKITLALGFLLVATARLSAAASLHGMFIRSHSAHSCVLVSDANGGDGGGA